MRYVSGTDLRQMIKKRGRLQPETALFLLGQAARALDAAHRKGLVHRDVKPGNLLIERGGDEGNPDHVYLADFGITKHAMSRSGLTSTGQFLGTIDYVAPEQIRGTSVLGLADQYSLGCVLYECLTGRVPFEKDLDAAIIWAHVEETPAMPTVLRPDLPPEVDEVFGRVLAKRPDERYGSCREFIDAARMALGIGGGSTQSSLAYGVTATGLGVSTPSVSQTGEPTDRYSWSSPSHAANPAAPGSLAAMSPSGPRHSWSGQSWSDQPSGGHSGYNQPEAGQPGAGTPPPPGQPKGPRWYRQPRWLAALAAAVVLLAGLGTWAGLSGSGSHARASTMPSMSPKPKPKPTTSALMNAIILTNKSAHAQGLLPPSTCKQASATHVTCTAPAAGISGVVFQTYPDQKALYAAYTAEVSSLNSGKFRQDFADCGSQATYGEVGWNHLYQHTRKYTVDQMTMGMVTETRPPAGCLQLHPGPGVHGLDQQRQPPDGVRGRGGARRRVELVGRGPPRPQPRRPDEHAHASRGRAGQRRRHLPGHEPVPVHDRHVRVPLHERHGRITPRPRLREPPLIARQPIE